MKDGIDFEDLSGGTEVTEEPSAPVSPQQAAFENRMREFAKVGQDDPISPKNATGMSTVVLIMSVTQFPPMFQEVGTACHMANASGNTALAEMLSKSIEVMKASYEACAGELDERLPPRATLEESGLDILLAKAEE